MFLVPDSACTPFLGMYYPFFLVMCRISHTPTVVDLDIYHFDLACEGHQNTPKQECIPVGCVASAAVAVSPGMHAPTTHAPLPCTPPCHAHPYHAHPLPCTPHACPPATHATLPRTPTLLYTSSLWTEWQTLVKTLHFHNYCCGRYSYFMNILRCFDDHLMLPQSGPHYVWASLCQVSFYEPPLLSSCFTFWHLRNNVPPPPPQRATWWNFHYLIFLDIIYPRFYFRTFLLQFEYLW